ncbi:16S rRNA (uracil(1498)-N(3))-methyltransferase [Radiobacillus sp. PE A8.2]|uniref:16S rRNA (uracil(1498)-N(3))-methyltransferase n=1 Tax=Radiobacillus sp. PE A8.2 TaxID=3380349 RepID=UPI00388E957C
MQRYFVPQTGWQDDSKVIISGSDVHHILRVMRMETGDTLICNHPDGKAARCNIIDTENEQVTVTVQQWLHEQVELPVHVTIAQGLPKGDKLEYILQKGTELGASAFLPFQAKRSIVKWDEKKAAKKLDRYERIVKEASEQSHRTLIPEVKSISSFPALLEQADAYDYKIIAYEEEARSAHARKLSDILGDISLNQSMLACIGPEGGFDAEEVEALTNAGFLSVRLGPRILRTETASLYLLSSISYHFEELR